MKIFSQNRTWVYVLACFALAGCTKGKISEITDTVKKKVTSSPVVPQAVVKTGSIEFGMTPPVKIGSGFTKFASFQDGRPSILSITSYRESSEETYPSALIHAQTDVTSLSELAGKTMTAEIYVAPDSSSTWHTPTGQLAQIKISAVNDEEVTGTIVSGTIVKAGDKTESKLTGSFKGLLK